MIDWIEKNPGLWELNVNVIVMHVQGAGQGPFYVTASHGSPEGSFSSLQAAQEYGKRYAGLMIERTLTGLSELEAKPIPMAIGYKPKPCVLLSLVIKPPESGSDEDKRWKNTDGTVNVVYANEQRYGLISKERTRLRGLLAEIGR